MKHYYIEAKFHANRWTLLRTEQSYKEALNYTKEHASDKYPIRIVRVVRDTVFEDKKK